MQERPRPRRTLYDDPFWAFVADGELRLQQCKHCAVFRYPPGPVCPECLAEDFSWRPLSGRGTLLSWTVFHRQYFPGMTPPYVVAAVRTPEGPILIGNLVGLDPPDLSLDMPLSVTFEDVSSVDGDWRICLWQHHPTTPPTTPGATS